MSDNRKDMIELALEHLAKIAVAIAALGLIYQGLFCIFNH